ncbi:carotenoid oxygenase [Trichoderma ceciliae]
MALNGEGTISRTADDEEKDIKSRLNNWEGEAWKEWPAKAQFEGLEEHRGPVQLSVKGSIPSWAAGSLFRTGPGLDRVEGTSKGTHFISHWFDGIAHSHRFDIVPPKTPEGSTAVVYSSRRHSDGAVAEIKKKGWRSSISFAQRADPCVGIFAKVMTVFVQGKSNNNVTVIPDMPGGDDAKEGDPSKGKALYVLSDSATLTKLDPKTLEPIGDANQTSLHPSLKGPVSCAHSQRDPETGDLFNYNLEFSGPKPTYRIFRVNAKDGSVDILAAISGKGYPAAYMHSFFITENHVVFCVQSTHFPWSGMKILWKRNVLDAIKPFDGTVPCKWAVVDRRQGKGVVGEFSTPAGFFFHSVNAFEEPVRDEEGNSRTDICMDAISYGNADIMKMFYYDILLDRNGATKKTIIDRKLYKSTQHHLSRYRFRMPSGQQSPEEKASAVAEEVLAIPGPHVGELPTIHPALAGKPYRYVYTTNNRGLYVFTDSIAKTDVHTKGAVIWSGPRGHSPGEPIFVPRPGGTDEDDGVLLSVVLDGTLEKSYLVCLDARTMEELGRAEADFAIPMGLHGAHQGRGATLT